MGSPSISNYNPLESFSSVEFQQINSPSSNTSDNPINNDYNPLTEFLSADIAGIKDESLKSSITQMSEDFKSIINNDTSGEPLFFLPDVIENDLFNIKPVSDLKDHHEHVEPLQINSGIKDSQFEVFDSQLSNMSLEIVLKQFDGLDLHILTEGSLEKLKTFKEAFRTSQGIIRNDDKELELDIRKVNVKRNPQEVAWAVQNQAFVALTKISTTLPKQAIDNEETEESEGPQELKINAQWASLVNKHVKKINVYDDEGKLQRELHHNDFKVVEFTAAEVEFISRLSFIAVKASFQLRKREEKEASDKEKINGDRQIQSTLAKQKIIAEINGNVVLNHINIDFNSLTSIKTSSLFLQVLLLIKSSKEKMEEEKLKGLDDKHYRIIKNETQQFESKTENKKLDYEKIMVLADQINRQYNLKIR